MLSLTSLLNPVPPGPQPPAPRYRSSTALSSPAPSYSSESPILKYERHVLPSSTKQSKMAKDSTIGFIKSRAKGTVNYPPFENLSEALLREIEHYQIYMLGRIQEFCRHIPYNSGKKNFFDKTGRESFEVFQYTFKIPGDDNEYTVMWDYNVGLVRMTPFFKCCKYSKTQPAKMLNMNPGLRDITHSITGGSIMAQGYWMPFKCARAVCATFCAAIAGALIPIFGPNFPSQCVPLDAPEYGRMVIDQAIVAEATREAELYRRVYANASSVNENRQFPHHYGHYSYHSHHQQQQQHSQHYYYSHSTALPSPTSIPSPRLSRPILSRYGPSHTYEPDRPAPYDGVLPLRRSPGSPCGTTSEPESSTGLETPSSLYHSPLNSRGSLFPPLSPLRSSGWAVVNSKSTMNGNNSIGHGHVSGACSYQRSTYREERRPPTPFAFTSSTNPLLSAIPRSGEYEWPPSSSSIASSTNIRHVRRQDFGRECLPSLPLTTSSPPNINSDHAGPHKNSNTTPWRNSSPQNKRPATGLLDDDDDYDDHSGSSPTTTTTTATSQEEMEDDRYQKKQSLGSSTTTGDGGDRERTSAEKNAALLLVNLSVRDNSNSSSTSKHDERENSNGDSVLHVVGARCQRFEDGCGSGSICTSPVAQAVGGHRSKRRRATSM